MKKDIHGGDIVAVARKLGIDQIPKTHYDFSVNINPFGMPCDVERLLTSFSVDKLSNYPELHAESAVKHLAQAHVVPEECVLVGNGSTEIFLWIIEALQPEKAHCIAPCYSGYSEICRVAGVPFEIADYAQKEDDFKINFNSIDFSDIELIFLATPNNPTGITIDPNDIISLAEQHQNTFFAVDESFIDFLPDAAEKSLCAFRNLPKNIAVVKSLTKFFALAGIRLGMVYAHKEQIAKFAEKQLPWSVNAMAQETAQLLYKNNRYICETRRNICELRRKLASKLSKIDNLTVYPGEADFLLISLNQGRVMELQKKLLLNGILIRSCTDIPGLDEKFFRIAIRTENENNFLIKCLAGEESVQEKDKKMQPIMVVGTTSGAGKSIIAAAFCRYFARKGVKVAPFKAQNMSLNSFVTKDGGEMGRAQVVQAQAAGVEPHTDMNPVLLKPTGDAGSQLILNGKVVGNFGAREYYEEKSEIREDAHKAFDRLFEKYELIILEGAGSPAEINLMDDDFVNMSMAEYANAKTILVADINPGGVFASIYGTIKLIPEKYRKLICGIIINKFRGDVTLLDSGIDEIEKLTGIPVLGVLPYLTNLDIEEEDSMGLDERSETGSEVLILTPFPPHTKSEVLIPAQFFLLISQLSDCHASVITRIFSPWKLLPGYLYVM